MLKLALFLLSVSAITCKRYGLPNDTDDDVITCADNRRCIKYSYTSDEVKNALVGTCSSPSMGCDVSKGRIESLRTNFADWECFECDTDNCNSKTSSAPSGNSGPSAPSGNNEPSAPSGNNGAATSKTFFFVYEVLGDKACVSATTEIECTEAQINKEDELSLSKKNKFTIGDCGDEFKKTCTFELEHEGETVSWPLTEKNNGNGCGEMVGTVLMEDCSICDNLGNMLTHEASTTDVISHPTCENVSDGFINDFINKVKDGELLYIGIAVALVVVPLIFFLICCCCCMAAQSKGVTTYRIGSRV